MKKILKHLKSSMASVKGGNIHHARMHVGRALSAMNQAIANPGMQDTDNDANEPDTDGDDTMPGKNWISGAIQHPGALHKELGVPQGETIPAKKIDAAANSDNPTLARRANLAKTLKKMHGGKK